MTIEEELGPPIPEHEPLPDGQWWACEYPERFPESGKVQFRRECRRCFPAFMAAKNLPSARITNPDTERKVRIDEAQERAWFFREGEYADS